MQRVMVLPSCDGQDYIQVFGVPDGMSEVDANALMCEAVAEYSAADRVWCEDQEGEQPMLSDFVKKQGFIVFSEVLQGPTWD